MYENHALWVTHFSKSNINSHESTTYGVFMCECACTHANVFVHVRSHIDVNIEITHTLFSSLTALTTALSYIDAPVSFSFATYGYFQIKADLK